MTDCPHCHQPDQDHDEVVDDGGRVKRYCPQPSPRTDTSDAIARIREIRAALEETK